jgi:hypothetical protein
MEPTPQRREKLCRAGAERRHGAISDCARGAPWDAPARAAPSSSDAWRGDPRRAIAREREGGSPGSRGSRLELHARRDEGAHRRGAAVVWRAVASFLAAANVAAAKAAMACPSCEAGRAARGMVLSNAFWLYLWAIALPFVVVVLLGRAVLRRIDAREAAAGDAVRMGAQHDG